MKTNITTTESASSYNHLENMTVREILVNINHEDNQVAKAVKKAIPQIESLVNVIAQQILSGGRLFYIGSGSSGRLGVLDAAEIPPTYGMPDNIVIGIIAGGDTAIRKAVEHAEDDEHQAWIDLKQFDISKKDILIGISASGRTPYVVGGVSSARQNGILTGCITCNKGSQLSACVNYPIEVIVGAEFVTGSTRMKAGTAQKMILNMISTATMVRLGRVKDNKMVDMKVTNSKLVDRGIRIIQETMNVDEQMATALLKKYGSIREVISREKPSLNLD